MRRTIEWDGDAVTIIDQTALPADYRVLSLTFEFVGADDGNRTRVFSLGSRFDSVCQGPQPSARVQTQRPGIAL